jgi:hypothetical protein
MRRMVGAGAGRPTGVLVVSAWYEGEPPILAARITYTLDVTVPDRITITAAGLDAIDGVVRKWLREIEAPQTW